jgi:hypothetical protein
MGLFYAASMQPIGTSIARRDAPAVGRAWTSAEQATAGDRRIGSARLSRPGGSLGGSTGTVLIDGFWQGIWKISRPRPGTVTLRVEPFTELPAEQAAAVTAEGTGLLAFVAPDAEASEIQLAAANLSEPHPKTP